MADKVVSGIGRELRYFEYKLRKKQQSSKKGKKDKNGNNMGHQQLAWSDAPTSEEFRFTPATSEELRKAMPGSRGEEDLQIQVALAMSREEQNETLRQSESDKLRLEMALKESSQEANRATKVQPARSLLDLSTSSPKPGSTADSLFGSTATNDPWGASAPMTSGPTFDPFAPQQSANTQPARTISNPFPPATDNFSASDDGWGISQTTQPVPQQMQNPWGVAQSFTPQQQPVAQPSAFQAPQATDPWGNDAPAAPASGNAPTVQNGAWGNPDPFLSTQPAQFDPFAGSSTTPSNPQSNAFGMPITSVPAQPLNNGFAMAPTSTFTTQPFNPAPTATFSAPSFDSSSSSTFTAPPFDPLKDFDSLHIGNSEPKPVMLQNDFRSGKSVANDIFPLNQVLKPEPISATKTNGEMVSAPVGTMTAEKETEFFLGANSSLVNLDSGGWKTYQVPFCAKPLGNVSHNPFQQTAPAKTMNEMKSTKQPSFT